MSRYLIITVSIIGLLTFSTITLFFKNSADKKKIFSLKAQIDELKSNVLKSQEETSEYKEKINDLEDKLSKVKHFDNDASTDQVYSSSSENLAYTGNAMNTKINGKFEGWDGETIFKMINGSIWQQSSYDYTYHYAYMPDVIIYKKAGTYYMKVEGMDNEISVRKIH